MADQTSLTPGETVTAFINALEGMDVAAAAMLAHVDISYENVPMNPVQGREAMVAVLDVFLGQATAVDWPVRLQIEDGGRVMNERLDRFQINDAWLEIPVVGVFEVDDDGLITLWRDYFDADTYTSRLAEIMGS